MDGSLMELLTVLQVGRDPDAELHEEKITDLMLAATPILEGAAAVCCCGCCSVLSIYVQDST